MKIVQYSHRSRHDIEFEEYERNAYVGRLLDIFNSGSTEEDICARAYDVHLELATKPDLYIAVFDKIGSRYRSAMHWYSQCRGVYVPRPKYKVEE